MISASPLTTSSWSPTLFLRKVQHWRISPLPYRPHYTRPRASEPLFIFATAKNFWKIRKISNHTSRLHPADPNPVSKIIPQKEHNLKIHVGSNRLHSSHLSCTYHGVHETIRALKYVRASFVFYITRLVSTMLNISHLIMTTVSMSWICLPLHRVCRGSVLFSWALIVKLDIACLVCLFI